MPFSPLLSSAPALLQLITMMQKHNLADNASCSFQVWYTALRDPPLLERQAKFIGSLREGHLEIVRSAAKLEVKQEQF
jgi:hypothetical protein